MAEDAVVPAVQLVAEGVGQEAGPVTENHDVVHLLLPDLGASHQSVLAGHAVQLDHPASHRGVLEDTVTRPSLCTSVQTG